MFLYIAVYIEFQIMINIVLLGTYNLKSSKKKKNIE